jgi:hypothetical protein
MEWLSTTIDVRLLNRAANLRENGAGIRPNHAHDTDDNYEDNRKHDRVFSDILSFGTPAKIV